MDLLSVTPEHLRALLDVSSEVELNTLLAAHPGLRRYAGVVPPMMAALNMMMIADNNTSLDSLRLVSVREVSEFVSGLIWEDPQGKRTVELVEIAAGPLGALLDAVPELIRPYIPVTLQVSLHHPDYLSQQSADLLEVMLTGALEPGLRDRIARFREAVLACVEHGVDRDLLLAIRAKMQPDA